MRRAFGAIFSILLLVFAVDAAHAQRAPDCGDYANRDGQTVPRVPGWGIQFQPAPLRHVLRARWGTELAEVRSLRRPPVNSPQDAVAIIAECR